MEQSTKTPVQTTINLQISPSELLKGLEFVHSVARSAPVPAGTHEEVSNVLKFIAAGIQPEPETQAEAPAGKESKPLPVDKKKESDRPKHVGHAKTIPLADKK